MKTINIHQAKTHLSRIVEEAASGETIVIAKAGRPMAKLTPLDSPGPGEHRRLGFLKGQIQVPDDFDRMGEEIVTRLFEKNEE
ncbi:MAG: type II toxin-antitoxin system Phd/YefM family antitoxin [Gammaproteobacteria bacterium]|nr:MAG: type II toxin-antitoxin system Phd/YefM family antitoxin [Gammaproteobacteria bacterium]